MSTTGERLRYIIDNQTDNVKEFCKKNNLNYTGLLGIMKDERPLGINVLQQLKEIIPAIDSEWLLFGTDRETLKNEDYINNVELAEPSTNYVIDPFETMILKYLERPKAQKLIENSVKKVIKLQLGTDGPEHSIEFGEENSPMMQKLEEIVKRELKKGKK